MIQFVHVTCHDERLEELLESRACPFHLLMENLQVWHGNCHIWASIVHEDAERRQDSFRGFIGTRKWLVTHPCLKLPMVNLLELFPQLIAFLLNGMEAVFTVDEQGECRSDFGFKKSLHLFVHLVFGHNSISLLG